MSPEARAQRPMSLISMPLSQPAAQEQSRLFPLNPIRSLQNLNSKSRCVPIYSGVSSPRLLKNKGDFCSDAVEEPFLVPK